MKNPVIPTALLIAWVGTAPAAWSSEGARLIFSDGRPAATSLASINETLRTVGVRLTQVDVPRSSIPLLQKSLNAPLTADEKSLVLREFSLSRDDMIRLTRSSGREPAMPGGGSMSTGEVGVEPYPKVYDLKSMTAADKLGARDKFAKLHVNFADGGTGVDEVMTLPSGGPWTWYFQIQDQLAVKLEMDRVEPGARAWRLIYPGLVPHGAYFSADSGLCVAFITGPQVWKMRYEAPGMRNADLLGKNPWIDFASR